ncbi:hypothetical protein J31TS4_19360 [Paenibacillus sp. J31TS4]|uniref:hypothetical protein n=1 Tax=Paenibacillus sp. J31TS4 TaxID=2807195 RepID=UPI001B0545A6|nr:hypothetical protein [Paenibacillus sp. J31TS4]GIP38656.1 hypothetical protein J31TS4_19360 [Paenibacillus sp. J31TS4]
MAIPQKRCLFCEKPVNVKPLNGGSVYLFRSCYCTGDGEYRIGASVYDQFNRMDLGDKRDSFYLISAYIREQTDRGEEVELLAGNTAVILESPLIPRTVEAKMDKLLSFLHRNAQGPGDEVQLDPMHASFNLTYSPNLQEFIYILEQLKTEKLINRVGATLSLTEQGWEAAERLYEQEQRPGKLCYISMTEDSELLGPMKESVFPRLRDKGYEPLAPDQPAGEPGAARDMRREIGEADLLIADVTVPKPHLYFEAGYAEGLGIEVIYTVRQDAVWEQTFGIMQTEPLVWETADELADKLVVKLASLERKAAKAR